jgi:general secretion pathway protein G
MNKTRCHHHNGFSLIEVLVVVVILGILAAIMIPNYSNASVTAQSNALLAQLQTLRSQLEFYRIQHDGQYPTIDQLWDNLTTKTTLSGNTTAGEGETLSCGPYLLKAPSNAFNGQSKVVDTIADPEAANGPGWLYVVSDDRTTCILKGIVTQYQADAGSLTEAQGDIVIFTGE